MSAWRFLIVLVGVQAALVACGSSSSSVAQTTPTPQPSPSPSPLTCTSSGTASSSWTVPTASTPSILSATASGDVLTLTFAQGTPAFQVTPESSQTFYVGDGKGETVTMAGSAGAIIVLQGFRGDILNYGGPNDITSTGPMLLEVRHVNEFEGVVHWAVGLNKAGCANVTSGATSLTFRFISAA